MKYIQLKLLLGCLLILAGCASDTDISVSDSAIDVMDDSENSFLASVEGIALNANLVTVIEDASRLSIDALNTQTTQRLLINLPENLETGTFSYEASVSADMANGRYYPVNTENMVFISESGLLTITEFNSSNKTIKGNTVFTASNPNGNGVIEITFCEFTLSY